MKQHRCGGTLQPYKLRIRKKTGYYYQNFTVDGFKCDCCGEEIISREIAFEIDKTLKQLKELWKDWRIQSGSVDSRVRPLYPQPMTWIELNEQRFEDSTELKT